MNKRKSKKQFRKYVFVMPQGRRTKAGIWKRKLTRESMKEMLMHGK